MLDNVETYTELCMKLRLMGVETVPPESLFNMVLAEDNALGEGSRTMNWFLGVVKWWVEHGKDLSKMNLVNTGLL